MKKPEREQSQLMEQIKIANLINKLWEQSKKEGRAIIVYEGPSKFPHPFKGVSWYGTPYNKKGQRLGRGVCKFFIKCFCLNLLTFFLPSYLTHKEPKLKPHCRKNWISEAKLE